MSKTCFISQFGWKTSLEVKKYTNRRKKRRNEKRRDQKTFCGSIADREKYSFVDLYNSVILNNQFSDKMYKTKQFRGNLVHHAEKKLINKEPVIIYRLGGMGGGGGDLVSVIGFRMYCVRRNLPDSP